MILNGTIYLVERKSTFKFIQADTLILLRYAGFSLDFSIVISLLIFNLLVLFFTLTTIFI